MNNYIPKIIAAHDLSGMGKASLTVATPILSVMGSYVCPLPTAVLSTITGVFEGYSITDLTSHMEDTVKHWDTLGIKFDYLYSGFLGSPHQVDIIIDAAERFKCRLMVDPAFGDHGNLYSTMTDEMVKNMRRLVSKAELITPNLTEAMFLLNEKAFPKNKDEITSWLLRLADMGPNQVIITSCEIGNDMYVCAYDKGKKQFLDVKCQYVPITLHGTGDMFASVVIGSIIRGDSFEGAIKLAVDFIREAILITLENGLPTREGAVFEKILYKLALPLKG